VHTPTFSDMIQNFLNFCFHIFLFCQPFCLTLIISLLS
jgi:hypothetical protein